MKTYALAARIYEESADMDFMDYEDTREQSINFIAGLLDSIGETDTRKLLATM